MIAAVAERTYDSVRKREKRAEEKDLRIPPPANPARRANALSSPYEFLATYFPGVFRNWSPSRREMVEAIFEALRTKTAQAIAAPRRDGKTSITIGVTAYCILKGLVKYGVLVSATGPTADELLENLKGLFERNQLLLEDFPEVCIPVRDVAVAPARAGGQTANGELTHIEWTSDRAVFPHVAGSECSGTVIRAVGITGSMRGMNKHFVRPDLVIVDDPDDEESAASKTTTDKRVRKIQQTIRGLAGEDSDIARVMLCTLINCTCVAAKFTDRRVFPAWNGRRFKLIEEMPLCVGSEDDKWAKYVDMVQEDWEQDDRFARRANAFYLQHRAEMDAGGKVSNEDRFYGDILDDGTSRESSTLQHAFNLIADIGWDSFQTEYQNDPPTDEQAQGSGISVGIVRGSATGYEGRMSGLGRTEIPPHDQVVAFIDVNDSFLTWEVAACLGEDKYLVVDYDKTETVSPSVVGLSRAIKTALDDVWRRFRQWNYDIDVGFIDSGDGDHTEAIYQWVSENGGPWYPSKGDGKYRIQNVKVGQETRRSPHRWHFTPLANCSRPLIVMDTNHWKALAHGGFLVKPLTPQGEHAPGAVRLFGKDPHSHTAFAKEICAEVFERQFVEGKGYEMGWVRKSKANHFLDTHYGVLCASSVARVVDAARRAPQRRFGVLSKGV